jgi:pyrroloquinoline quinone biosynthesis protein E
MKPALGTCWDLHLKNGNAYIYRRQDHQVLGSLTNLEAIILVLMDGSRTKEELSNLLDSALGESGTTALDFLLDRWGALLVDGCHRQLPYSLEGISRVTAPSPRQGLRPLPGPRVLHWWVTDYCPRRCVYCFAQPKRGSLAREDQLSRNRLQEIFKEAASLGAKHLLLGGGEPLLRADLPEIMGNAIKHNITPLLTTKHPITKSLAYRFFNAGVNHISLSLDTLDKEENRTLIGAANYGEQVKGSAGNLTEAGVSFSIQAVITRLNLKRIKQLAAFASDIGAQTLQVVPFLPVREAVGPLSNKEMALDTGELEFLQEEVKKMAQQFPSINVELFEELGSGSRTGVKCDIGITKLFFLPNGVVHRCYKLTRDHRLRGADLRKVSLAAAWHDPGFQPIISPPGEKYSKSPCGKCQQFDQCHKEGRCIYQAMVNHGQYEAKDRSCEGPY